MSIWNDEKSEQAFLETIEYLDGNTQDTTHTYKVGDKVEVIGHAHSFSLYNTPTEAYPIGYVGVISSVDFDCVVLEGGIFSYDLKDIRLVKSEEQPKARITKDSENPDKNPDLEADYSDTSTEELVAENLSLLEQINSLREHATYTLPYSFNVGIGATKKLERKIKYYVRNRKELERRLPADLKDAFLFLEED